MDKCFSDPPHRRKTYVMRYVKKRKCALMSTENEQKRTQNNLILTVWLKLTYCYLLCIYLSVRPFVKATVTAAVVISPSRL